jgi:hypothetical protein
MKILYLSCHSTLEYDECKLLTELGHEVYSLGSYTNPHNPSDKKRPPIPGMPYDDHFLSLAGRYSKDFMHPEMIEDKDVIIVMHVKDWIINNWGKIKHKKVIWRSIGQSNEEYERDLLFYKTQGLKIVRYAVKEAAIPGYIGGDAMIPFYKDPEEFKGWDGLVPAVVTFAQSMKQRGDWCRFNIFAEATKDFPRFLYGPDNNVSGIPGGLLDYEHMKEILQHSRVYFYTGTYPASYTLGFIEAWMTGIPIVAIGRELSKLGKNTLDTYQIQDLITNETDGFVSDNLSELKKYIDKLLDDPKYAKKIGDAGRKRAIEIFGKDFIKKKWQTYLESL